MGQWLKTILLLLHWYFASYFVLIFSNLNCCPNKKWIQKGEQMCHFFPNTLVVYERKWVEKQQSYQLFHLYVYNSCKERSFSDMFGFFQKRSVPVVSNLIVDTLMSAWIFDCHQTEEEHLQKIEQTENQQLKSNLTSVLYLLPRHFSPTRSIIFSHKKEQ